jgi:signal peptidase I
VIVASVDRMPHADAVPEGEPEVVVPPFDRFAKDPAPQGVPEGVAASSAGFAAQGAAPEGADAVAASTDGFPREDTAPDVEPEVAVASAAAFAREDAPDVEPDVTVDSTSGFAREDAAPDVVRAAADELGGGDLPVPREGLDPPAAAEPALVAAAATPASDLRLTSPGIRLAQVQEELLAWVKTLLSAAVYAILIVTFGFQVARVEGQSMAPTLEDQDRLIVNKLVYRIGEPRRGDIVMLYYPLNPDKSFVKRVIAEETDSVRIVDGRVYVNDVPLHDDYVPTEYRSHDDWGPQVIPEGYYFVMGDHRNNSSDSRHWGMVPKKYIIGKVQVRWWPVPTARVF